MTLRSRDSRHLLLLTFLVLSLTSSASTAAAELRAELRVGATAVDITPSQFPVLVNGGMVSNSASRATSPLHARAIVIDDGQERIAIVVVDSCMLPRPFLDEVKQRTAQQTTIKPNRIMISATHTHSAPSAMGCLGTDAEESYLPLLREKIAESIVIAESLLQSARVGWGVRDAAEFTALRRWIIRPDRMIADPFGNLTVRANMHAGANWDNVTGESGPEDPDLSLIAFQSLDNRLIAVLANFSMHYFSGVEPLNADYFGLFCRGLEQHFNNGDRSTDNKIERHPCVAIMSHGCSGDIWRRDYTQPSPQKEPSIDAYTKGLVDRAIEACNSMTFQSDATVSMSERRMRLKYRVPDQQRLAWAAKIVEQLGKRMPMTNEEVYAREQIILHERQDTEIVVQAIRIGDFAIATTPTETYALTGLKIKLQSPLAKTMVIELANGGDGYIPPPEQHLLGGYNTWPARSAGLEIAAESRITEAALEQLEKVSNRARQNYEQPRGPAVRKILDAQPIAYWRLDEFSPPVARDLTNYNHVGHFEPGVVFFLQGPQSDLYNATSELTRTVEPNRAAHFAGGRLSARLRNVADDYSMSLWFWNGMPADGRATSGWIFSRDYDHGRSSVGEHIGIGGSASQPGKLIYQRGNPDDDAPTAIGRSVVDRWTWNHLVFNRCQGRIRIYLNGHPDPEIDTQSPQPFPSPFDQFFFGGRSDNHSNWEGRLDEIAVFNRSVSAQEILP